jgi:hypothetical protein
MHSASACVSIAVGGFGRLIFSRGRPPLTLISAVAGCVWRAFCNQWGEFRQGDCK